MRTARYLVVLISFVALLSVGSPSMTWAAGCTTCDCDSCNECPKGCGEFRCDCRCDKACEPKRTTKKIEITCWECVCKKICLAGKSCGCQGTCGKSRVVKHLVRKTIVKEVPIVKCEVVDGGSCDAAPCDARDPRNDAPFELPSPPPLAKKQGFLGGLFARSWDTFYR